MPRLFTKEKFIRWLSQDTKHKYLFKYKFTNPTQSIIKNNIVVRDVYGIKRIFEIELDAYKGIISCNLIKSINTKCPDWREYLLRIKTLRPFTKRIKELLQENLTTEEIIKQIIDDINKGKCKAPKWGIDSIPYLVEYYINKWKNKILRELKKETEGEYKSFKNISDLNRFYL